MFEYLMPALVMRSFPFTLLDQTYQRRGAAADRLRRGARRAVGRERERLQPARPPPDLSVPRLRRARSRPQARARPGPGDRAVRLRAGRAWSIPRGRSPTSARSRSAGALGPYGFRDALDYTRPAARPALCRRRRVHGAPHRHGSRRAHQRAARRRSWQRRFHADPDGPLGRAAAARADAAPAGSAGAAVGRAPTRRCPIPRSSARRCARSTPPTRRSRDVALLGHLPYTIMVSHGGGGYSRYEELAVTRWRADGTRDDTGQFCYVKDVAQRPGLVGRAPAGLRAGRMVPRPARHRPRHLPPRRRRHRDSHRDRRRPRRRRRGPARDGDQQRATRRARSS